MSNSLAKSRPKDTMVISTLNDEAPLMGGPIMCRSQSQAYSVNRRKQLTIALLIVGVVLVVCLIVVTTVLGDVVPAPESISNGALIRAALRDDSVHCLDGTLPSFYTRQNSNSTEWILFLEYGGSYCWDNYTCSVRTLKELEVQYTTSKFLTDTKEESGVLSADSAINPWFHNHNVISIPYCSSDLWLGNVTATEFDGNAAFWLQGALIIKATIEQALEDGLLAAATAITIWGQGAGGWGVLTQADNIKDYLAPLGSGVDIRAVMDSAWVPATPNYEPVTCSTASDCPLDVGARYLTAAAKPVYPQRCLAQQLTWQCLIAGRSNIESFSVPLMVFQWQYELSIFHQNDITLSNDTQAWADMVRNDRLSEFTQLPSDSGYHYPNCLDHEISAKEFIEVRGLLDGNQSLAKLVYDWAHRPGYIPRNYDTCTDVDCNPSCHAALDA